MNNNDVLRSLRYALNLGNAKTVEIFALAHHEISPAHLMALLSKEDDPGFEECTDRELTFFLDGLIVDRRGPRADAPPARAATPPPRLTNNEVLKKIRIALELKEEDMLSIVKLGGMEISASELGALFRKEQHKNYKPAGDQLLRYFLRGLTLRLRPAP
jgi:uncharacterized protein YehS (DUF1456 family)